MTAVWLDLAACAGHPVDIWFRDDAKAICQGCPVRTQCLDHAYLFGEFEHGIYGGLTPRERRRAWRHLGHRFRPANAQGAHH